MYLWKPIGGRTPSRTPSNQYPADDLDGNGAWSILPRRVRGNTSALGLSDLLICLPKYRVILQAESMFSWQTRATFSQGVSIGPLVAATAWTFHSMALTKACELRVEDFTHWVYLLGVTTEMQHASCTTYPNPKRTDFAPFTHGWLENYDFT